MLRSHNAILLALALAPAAWAYPPDNAAVLYYKASLMYKQPEGDLRDE